MQTDTELVLGLWSDLRWRHHGAGMLQAYLPLAHAGRQSRVHIWHRSLLKPGIVKGGAKHNHRFHLRSQVLHGVLMNSVLVPVPDPDGDHQLWRIEGASNRAQATLVAEERVRVVERKASCYEAGHSYSLLKWDYHWGRQPTPDDVHSVLMKNVAITLMTITLVDMVDKEGGAGAPRKGDGKWARLLCPHGFQPVHAFEDQMEHEEERVEHYRSLIDDARSYLEAS